MSKIQEAIKKVQESSQRRSLGGVDRAQELKPLGRVIETETEAGDAATEPSGGDVQVDFASLREAGLLVPEKQQPEIADQYRIIKRPLINNAMGRGAAPIENGNLIMVASAMPGDGKTFNCINLALSMAAEKDISVLMVDADVAKPHISRLFGVAEKPGLIDVLTEENLDIRSVIMNTNVPRLKLMPAGSRNEHATELLASNRMRRVVEQLSKSDPASVVIFDSPPLLPTSEARVLASFMGQIAMVVCAGRTPQRAVTAAIQGLDGTKAINLILNQATAGIGSEQYGGYGYGNYGAAAAD